MKRYYFQLTVYEDESGRPKVLWQSVLTESMDLIRQLFRDWTKIINSEGSKGTQA